MWSNSSIYSYLFPPSFQKDLIFLDLVFSVVVKCRIFKHTKVVLSMSQKEAAFYNKLKPLPFRVLKLLIYSVVGILEQLSSASPPVILQWLFILSGSWVACPCTVALCLVLLRQAVVLASRQRRQMFMAASPGPLNSTYSGWNVTSVVASCWLDFFKSWFRYIILAGKFFFFLDSSSWSAFSPNPNGLVGLSLCAPTPRSQFCLPWFTYLLQSSTWSNYAENE